MIIISLSSDVINLPDDSGMTKMTKTLISSDLGESRALDVFDGAEFFGQLFAHLEGEWLLLVLGQLLDCGGVVAEIDLEIGSCGTYWAPNFHQI